MAEYPTSQPPWPQYPGRYPQGYPQPRPAQAGSAQAPAGYGQPAGWPPGAEVPGYPGMVPAGQPAAAPAQPAFAAFQQGPSTWQIPLGAFGPAVPSAELVVPRAYALSQPRPQGQAEELRLGSSFMEFASVRVEEPSEEQSFVPLPLTSIWLEDEGGVREWSSVALRALGSIAVDQILLKDALLRLEANLRILQSDLSLDVRQFLTGSQQPDAVVHCMVAKKIEMQDELLRTQDDVARLQRELDDELGVAVKGARQDPKGRQTCLRARQADQGEAEDTRGTAPPGADAGGDYGQGRR
jgi:hypothetical protein